MDFRQVIVVLYLVLSTSHYTNSSILLLKHNSADSYVNQRAFYRIQQYSQFSISSISLRMYMDMANHFIPIMDIYLYLRIIVVL
jgi:hypothetical protein